jgi:hypothetical protein
MRRDRNDMQTNSNTRLPLMMRWSNYFSYSVTRVGIHTYPSNPTETKLFIILKIRLALFTVHFKTRGCIFLEQNAIEKIKTKYKYNLDETPP